MGYLVDLRPVGILLLLIYMVIDFSRRRTANLPRRVVVYSFLLYLLFVAQYTTGGIQIPPRPGITGQPIVQPLPLHFIFEWITIYQINYRFHGQGWFLWNSLKLVFYNLIMLFPLGVYLRVFGQKSLKKATLTVFLTSVLIETYQWVFSITGLVFARTFDMDDILLNTLGGAAGFYLCAAILHRWSPRLFQKKTVEEVQSVSVEKATDSNHDQAGEMLKQ